MRRTHSLEKTLMMGKIEGRSRRDDRGWDGWMALLTQWTWVWAGSRRWWIDREAWHAAVHGVAKHWTQLSDSAFRCLHLSFSPLFSVSLLFTAICKASPDSHFAFLHFFSMGMVLIPVSCTMSRICRWHHLYGRKWRGTKKPLDESERGEWKSWLKGQHSENEDHGIWTHHFMANRWGNSGNCQILFSGAPKSLQMMTAAMKLKDTYSLEGKLWPT